MEGLTVKRKKVLDFITRYIDRHGYAPSVKDILIGCQISSAAVVQFYLRVLERDGYIRRQRDIARSITLTSQGLPGRIVLCLCGKIAAGNPIPVPSAENRLDETVEVPGDLLRNFEGVYALKVEGLSMIDALVNDGDIVIIRPEVPIEDGDMVAAWLTDREEATLKKLYREKDRIRLQPANSAMAPIYVDPDKVQVQGKVVAVWRNLE